MVHGVVEHAGQGGKSRRSFLEASWRHLLMVNFTIAPAALRPFVPDGVELDLWEGRALVSVVGFEFLDLRLFGLALPGYQRFEEVNLRFYVVRRVDGERRRGVVFVKEIVPRRLVAWGAKWLYNEPYVAHPMTSQHKMPGSGDPLGMLEYCWRAGGRWNRLGGHFRGEKWQLEVGSEAEFIAEHYWGYGRQRDGSTLEYRVSHPPWSVWRVEDPVLDCDARSIYGSEFEDAFSRAPTSAFVADGSAVEVYRGMRL